MINIRMCSACRVKRNKDELIRIVLFEGAPIVDNDKKFVGRGCYICNSPDCIAKAIKVNSVAKSLKTAVDKTSLEILLKKYADQ